MRSRLEIKTWYAILLVIWLIPVLFVLFAAGFQTGLWQFFFMAWTDGGAALRVALFLAPLLLLPLGVKIIRSEDN